MIRTLWTMGQAALAISLFITVTGAAPTLAGDVKLVECRTDAQGIAGPGGSGAGAGACDYCRSHGLAGCRHGGGYGAGYANGYGPNGCPSGRCDGQGGRFGSGAYVNGLFNHASQFGRGGHHGSGGAGGSGAYWCNNCRAWHNGSGNVLAGHGLGGNGDCRNGQCDGNGCHNGRCHGGHCLGGKCYRPVEGYYNDPRDSEVYSAVGYNIPVSVPLAPVVRYQYNYGWGLPSSRLIQVGNTYNQYYPQPFFTQSGGRVPAGPPTIYQPTDTTQSGFYYSHAPRWTPVKRINSINYNYGW